MTMAMTMTMTMAIPITITTTITTTTIATRHGSQTPTFTFTPALVAGLLGERPQGMATSPSGYYLCTVLVDDASGRSIVVNRGWMPADVAERREWAKEDGVVEVVGVVGQGETPATFSPPNNPSSGTMLWFELPVLLQVSSHTVLNGLLKFIEVFYYYQAGCFAL